MSMYNVNCSVPKTLIRAIVKDYLCNTSDKLLSSILADVIDTPISPELKPGKDGDIAQKTEEIIGPYDVHDFYLYHFVRNGTCSEKLLYIAEKAFDGKYSPELLQKWLSVFMTKFIASQFKRNCVPDGPNIGSINLSGRGFSFPSDIQGTTVI